MHSKMIFSPLLAILVFSLFVQASIRFSPQLPWRLVHQFPIPTYPQSIHVRANGDILTTTVWPDASIYYLSGVTSGSTIATRMHKFQEMNASTSIIEVEPDRYVVLAGQQSSLGVGINGTFRLFGLDLRSTPKHQSSEASVSEIAHFTHGGLTVGIVPLPSHPNIVLVPDATMGGVWRVDIITGQFELAFEDKHMKPFDYTATYFGIDNLHLHKGYVYWTHSFSATVYRLPITKDGYRVNDKDSEKVKTVRALYLDNFAIGPLGRDDIWAASNANNELVTIESPGGTDTIVLGAPDQITLAGPVAAMFGRQEHDLDTLYVVTNGGMLNPVNGTVIEGGKIVAIDTKPFYSRGNDHTEQETEL